MSKAKAKRQTKGKRTKRGSLWYAWLLIAIGVAGIVFFIRTVPMGQSPTDHAGNVTAAIIDQLSSVRENEAFVANVTKELENYGFEVDLYQGDDITVDFYRELPTHGYKLIIFRAHSGLLAENEVTQDRTVLFTNEEYSQLNHYDDQLHDRLVMARVSDRYPMVFGIPPKFIKEAMQGEFDGAVVIMMGCSGLFLRDLAPAFVDKGASTYVAWNGTVELYYVDEATACLVGQLCSANITVEEAVESTMNIIGPDPEHGAGLEYYPTYPSDIGDKTLLELIQ